MVDDRTAAGAAWSACGQPGGHVSIYTGLIAAVEHYARQLPDRRRLTMRDGIFPAIQQRAAQY